MGRPCKWDEEFRSIYFPEDSPCEVKSFVRSGDVARDFAKRDAGGDGAATALATLH
jgi:hypothetical protein